MHKVLPISAVLVFLTCTAIAQLPLPASTQAHLGTLARLEALSLTDFSNVMSEGESGDQEAQYLIALICLEGRLIAKDFAAARSWMLKRRRDLCPR